MEKLDVGMKKQVMTFEILEEYCLSKYRKNCNPLPDLRKWLKDMEVSLSVAYMETAVPININQAVEWAVNKNCPVLIVHALRIDDFVLAVELFMLERNCATRPAKNYSITIKDKCHHCKRDCDPVELDEEAYMNIDMHGVQCLMEVDQFLYEGGLLCEECYAKEGGII